MTQLSSQFVRWVSLKRDGIVELEGKRRIVIPDFDRLSEEAGDDADGGFLV